MTQISQLNSSYDVIIVGGGINGVGIARDCALRGISCLLVEKGDFSAGTSWASSGMIHGGPRYLFYDKNVTRLACLDSGYIQKIAPHLLFRIPFLYPVYQEPGHTRLEAQMLLEGVESFFETYDEFVQLKNGKTHTRLTPDEVSQLEPNLSQNNLVGAVTFDEWGIDVPRLCIANVVDAVENGAHALNHTRVVKVVKEKEAFQAVQIRDELTGEEKTVSGKVLVNATGPWSPQFGKMAGLDIQLRGGKGIHLVFDRRLFNIAITAKAIDNREIFVLPYENTSIIGTTDDDFFGDLDEQKTSEDEIKYLLEGIEQVFPAIKSARMTYSYSGVRPTLYQRKVYEDELSREHEVLDHEFRDGIKGIISLIGGKLASYRIMAKETVDLIAQKLTNTKPCTTHEKPLPGGDFVPDVLELARAYEIDSYVVARLVYRHGSRTLKILDMMKMDRELSAIVCACEPVTKAEIEYVKANEMARTLSDIRMRTRLTTGPCQGTNCLTGAAQGMEDHVQSFLNQWWWNRAAVLNGEQLKQEELFQALHFCNNGLG